MKLITIASFLWIFQTSTSQPCAQGEAGCCETMIPPSLIPQANSSCWQWWETPSDGILTAEMNPLKGCDYQPCQEAVCACDSYCCDTAWDKSCRGYEQEAGGVQNNVSF